ncbi:histidine phosphatase family protein [Halobacillus sp. A5]|uniref:histidine phosphatase family protein n=1 Tax=Halobacillus sp. A5 TaxID=2880263 RepID=UPI0020A67DFC|nr:histidine phosphatase family protein [Halobacillus sp. A5]MCP3027869.1 histidine phosphatase family protein [Halobacillus sp. A5]
MADCVDFYLIRHGETTSNQERRYIGWRDEPLSDQGRRQINLLCRKLPPFGRLFSSDLTRCTETAGKVDDRFQVDRALREYHFGDFDGKRYAELNKNSEYQCWLNDMENVTPPNGESFSTFRSRVLKFMGRILDCLGQDEQMPVGIVTHGGVIRTLLQYFSKQTNSMWEWSIDPGEAYHLKLIKEGDEWILLQAERITAS